MVSPNHISYWQYLEDVKANRNREKETSYHNRVTEGFEGSKTNSIVSLNKTQELVNMANILKTKADTEVSYAMADKIAADTIVSQTMVSKLKQDIAESRTNQVVNLKNLELNQNKLKFDMDKFAKEYILSEKDVKIREGNLNLGIAKLQQELQIHTDKMGVEDRKLFQGYVEMLKDLVKQKTINETKLVDSLIGIVDFF